MCSLGRLLLPLWEIIIIIIIVLVIIVVIVTSMPPKLPRRMGRTRAAAMEDMPHHTRHTATPSSASAQAKDIHSHTPAAPMPSNAECMPLLFLTRFSFIFIHSFIHSFFIFHYLCFIQCCFYAYTHLHHPSTVLYCLCLFL